MFDGNQDFTGVQANYLKDLCELRGNVPDRAAHNNFKIFNSYVDAYTVYQILMLIDEDSEPDEEKRIFRAFKLSETSEEDKERIAENMKIFNEYFLGGVEVLHEQFVDECTDDDSYLRRMFEYVKKFNEEQDGEALKVSIDSFLNK